jgi:type I restriction enzyme S subunit
MRIMHDIVSGYANGTTVNMLPIDGLQSPLIVVPPARALSTFGSIAEAARMRHEEMVEESRTLAALRDALLPKLISGEMQIRDAERFVGVTAS